MLVLLILAILFFALALVGFIIFGIPCLIGWLVDTASEGSKGSVVAIILIILIILTIVISLLSL